MKMFITKQQFFVFSQRMTMPRRAQKTWIGIMIANRNKMFSNFPHFESHSAAFDQLTHTHWSSQLTGPEIISTQFVLWYKYSVAHCSAVAAGRTRQKNPSNQQEREREREIVMLSCSAICVTVSIVRLRYCRLYLESNAFEPQAHTQHTQHSTAYTLRLSARLTSFFHYFSRFWNVFDFYEIKDRRKKKHRHHHQPRAAAATNDKQQQQQQTT